ncbi:MAG: sigma 54-interacting transcriptional regulator, partial [Myxococcota bacterium]
HILREGEEFIIAARGRGRPLTVNGKKEKRARLKDGDAITVGEVALEFFAADVPDSGDHQDLDPTTRGAVAAYAEIVAFSQRLLRSEDLNALLTALMDKVIELSRADKGFLVLMSDGTPDIRVARNLDQQDVSREIQELSDTVLAKVVREQQPVIVTDALNDQEFKASASVVNLKLCSVMCVPLMEDGELFGLFYLGSSRVVNLFEPQLLETITVFAAQASLLIRNAMLLDRLRSDNESLRQAVEAKRFGAIVGSSDQMQEIYRRIRKVAPTDVSVLVTGETGTGKELIAREIHERSDRAQKPFIVLNCGAIPENLLESELFGHIKGAFTGAVATRDGRFQQADGGTLFLDE